MQIDGYDTMMETPVYTMLGNIGVLRTRMEMIKCKNGEEISENFFAEMNDIVEKQKKKKMT